MSTSTDVASGCDAYYRRVDADTFLPSVHAQGAWNDHEQHMAPMSGLLAHCIDRHEARDDLALARISYDILGLMPLAPTTVTVHIVRPGRTIEVVEAVAHAGGRPVVRARAWRLVRGDTAEVAGGEPDALPPASACEPWDPSSVWAGGFIASLEVVRVPGGRPGRGACWLRTRTPLVEGEPASGRAAFLGLVDTANGMNPLLDPTAWAFPNVDLTIHLHREPVGGPDRWLGFDTRVTTGPEGVGLTATVLHDESGPVGRAEQAQTVRRIAP